MARAKRNAVYGACFPQSWVESESSVTWLGAVGAKVHELSLIVDFGLKIANHVNVDAAADGGRRGYVVGVVGGRWDREKYLRAAIEPGCVRMKAVQIRMHAQPEKY